jgi:tetratricopeptide (TPR) repeat protein
MGSEVIASFRSPAEVSAAADHAPGAPPQSAQVEASIWRQIGEWRFARGETSPALLAFKQAEALFVQPREKAEARIAEARALLAINQTGAAISILTALTTDPDPQVNHHALAVLGNARIALDDIPGALTLLEAAVANDDSFPPALRAPARADLGLVCLMSSHEQKGLIWLHQAQADFQADRDNAGLVQCLRNEAAYLDSAGRGPEASIIRDRASRLAAVY